MQSLFVIEQGARISRRGDKVTVFVDGVKMEDARIDELAQCVVMGNVAITPQAVKALTKNGVDIVFTSRTGQFIGRMSGGLSRNILLRQSQFRRLESEDNRLDIAKRVVAGKIENQRRLLARYQKRRPHESIMQSLVFLRHSQRRVSAAMNLDELRGVEGSAGASYFSCWKNLLSAEDITFTRRMRRPPPDPVNILLSFGYTQLCNAIHAMVETSGMDPFLGALHAVKYGRPSLVLDIVEEFRPVIVDATVLRVINSGIISLRDFQSRLEKDAQAEKTLLENAYAENGNPVSRDATPKDGPPPTLFLKSGIKKWVVEYQRRMQTIAYYPPRGVQMRMDQIILAQVYLMAKHMESGMGYESFLSPR
ncbi:MAG: CRISPR-associated endonuclease Cas1 [Deltaproteobacteria bacterium]|nr:CRISPR-associated endonuclease Cas1 [Deltaproteobacteria bacterium]